jgi:hypothetical protein
MIHCDALRAIREDDAGWSAGQKGLAAIIGLWRARPEVTPALAELERFGTGDPIESCPALAALFDGASSAAGEFASGLVEAGIAGLSAHPLGQLPLRHGVTQAAHTLLLAHWGSATLALVAFDGEALASLPAPASALFSPIETWSHVLAGSGTAGHVFCREPQGERAELQAAALPLQPGTVLYRNGRHESLEVWRARGTLVKLRLQRFLGGSEPAREYALADGALLHQAAARPEDSRCELAMAVLARMGRRDAVPAMSRIALGPGHEALRWQALRELLTLDTRAGMVLLAHFAACDDDPLSVPARELHASLLVAWPELEEVARWRA